MNTRDHGGNLDAAMAKYGGQRSDWVDLSTGINPVPYPVSPMPDNVWSALPDKAAMQRLLTNARMLWNVPQQADILAAPGCSALIAQIPTLRAPGTVSIARPTYNEHAAAFEYHGWAISGTNASADRP